MREVGWQWTEKDGASLTAACRSSSHAEHSKAAGTRSGHLKDVFLLLA